MLQHDGWFKFLLSFPGHNTKVTRAFSFSFEGKYVRIRDVELQIDENVISKYSSLPTKGERWSKTKMVRADIPWSEFISSPRVKYGSRGGQHLISTINNGIITNSNY
jgi:hypothetical protein